MSDADDDPFGEDWVAPPLVDRLRARACPAGEPHTGDHPELDHGHTDCWLYHQAADRIDALEKAAFTAYVPLATSAHQTNTGRYAARVLADVLVYVDDPLATDESPQGLAQAYAWWHFQNGYRRSQASPPERSIGCEADIEHLRALAAAWGRPDPRAVVEVGMEHLWQIVYGEPYPT